MEVTEIERRALKGGAGPPNLSELPVRVPRDEAAKLLTRYYFETSPRTLERWALPWRLLNGKAHVETKTLFAEAERRLAAAPVVMGGQKVAA